MKIGFTRELFPGETRVALTPAMLPRLRKAGYEILLEQNAGALAGFPDSQYIEQGGTILPTREEVIRAARMILYVRGLGSDKAGAARDIPLLAKDQVILGLFTPSAAQSEISLLVNKGIAVFALEMVPRISRAQNMDVLSSMATVAGYWAVLEAALHSPKMFPMMTTAAGTVPAARAFVLGAGVAGLQAIATAKRLGAIVHAYDIRPAVREQIESLGGKFVSLPLEVVQAEGAGGYAAAQGEEFLRKQRELLTSVLTESEVVISTAAVPGKQAPILITREMLRAMRPGSVIVDLAAEQGGNCEATVVGKTEVVDGIAIVGALNPASRFARDASQMFARNVTNFLLHLIDTNGALRLDDDDEIIRGMRLTAHGQ